MLPLVKDPETAVFVDELASCIPSQRWHWKESCHMTAYNLEALHAMAKLIGLKREWFQGRGGKLPHYDLTSAARNRAVAAGAIEIDRRDMVDLILYWRTAK